jgi:FHA domain-containing protein
MRAAMHGLIGRFEPKALEQRLASKSVLDAMVPGARKARLWELFNSLYSEVAREAEDDFDRLFGRAFVKAYEEQIARIEAGSAPREGGEPGRR